MTVAELQEKMTYEELQYWKAYTILEKEDLEHEIKKSKK